MKCYLLLLPKSSSSSNYASSLIHEMMEIPSLEPIFSGTSYRFSV